MTVWGVEAPEEVVWDAMFETPQVIYQRLTKDLHGEVARFHGKVLRRGRYAAQLVLTQLGTGVIVLDSPVTLAEGAVFGPDFMDIHEWERSIWNGISGCLSRLST